MPNGVSSGENGMEDGKVLLKYVCNVWVFYNKTVFIYLVLWDYLIILEPGK